MTEAVVSSCAIAEHPSVNLADRKEHHARTYETVRELEMAHPQGSRRAGL